MSAPQEVTIDVDSAWVLAWGVPIGNPRDEAPSTLLFVADDVMLALRQGIVVWPSRESLEVTRDGIAKVVRRDGRELIYELFPARFSDDKPYEPVCYVGRWPD